MCLDELESRGRFGRERREGPAKVREGTVDGFDLVTARPQTYMNVSGRAAAHLVGKYGVAPSDLIVVHDEVDLPLGTAAPQARRWRGRQQGASCRSPMRCAPRTSSASASASRAPPNATRWWTTSSTASPRRSARSSLPCCHGQPSAVMALVRDGLDSAMSEYNRAADD